MKRLWIAVGLCGLVVVLCVASQAYLHRCTENLLARLDTVERHYLSGDPQPAANEAQALADDYRRYSRLIACFVAHNSLADGLETAALLPALLSENEPAECRMEITRLREQLMYLQNLDNPVWQNIL